MTDTESLFAAVNDGDGVALLALADAMEEAGDIRAAGMRKAAKWKPGVDVDGLWCWMLPGELSMRRMLFALLDQSLVGESARFGTRAAAYLALALALTQEPASAQSLDRWPQADADQISEDFGL